MLIVLARIFSVLFVQYAFVFCGADHKLKFKECVFISYAGMIRGAIALGLAIKAEDSFSEYGFVVASVLAIVILSTLIFGSFMPLVARCLLDRPKSQKKARKLGEQRAGRQGEARQDEELELNLATPRLGSNDSNDEPLQSPSFEVHREDQQQVYSSTTQYHSHENKLE